MRRSHQPVAQHGSSRPTREVSGTGTGAEHRMRAGRLEFEGLVEHLLFELLQCGSGVEPVLGREGSRRTCNNGAPRSGVQQADQRDHELLPRVLALGLAFDRGLELGDELAAASVGELGVDARIERAACSSSSVRRKRSTNGWYVRSAQIGPRHADSPARRSTVLSGEAGGSPRAGASRSQTRGSRSG